MSRMSLKVSQREQKKVFVRRCSLGQQVHVDENAGDTVNVFSELIFIELLLMTKFCEKIVHFPSLSSFLVFQFTWWVIVMRFRDCQSIDCTNNTSWTFRTSILCTSPVRLRSRRQISIVQESIVEKLKPTVCRCDVSNILIRVFRWIASSFNFRGVCRFTLKKK